jgi:hypothetical protein
VRLGKSRCEDGNSNAQLHVVCSGKLGEQGKERLTSQVFVNQETTLLSH